MPSPGHRIILLIIVFSQFAGTSLWFVGNAAIAEFSRQLNTDVDIALITSVVQFGFIAGTFFFSLFSIADKFRSTSVFFISSLLASAFNLMILWWATDVFTLSVFRFLTGFFLAGIYPVGMKIAADIFKERTGQALGYLVGALVLGTAFPHLVRSQVKFVAYEWTIFIPSILAVIGGLLMILFIPTTKSAAPVKAFQPKAIANLFKSAPFRSAAFGYFGHMWELYSLWAFIPYAIILNNLSQSGSLDVSLWSFILIGVGALGCFYGGELSKKIGSKKVAAAALFTSGICCLLAPFLITSPLFIFVMFMLIWGFSVTPDSPQFSTLVAQTAPVENKGTALTFVTSIGFSITILSLQLLEIALSYFNEYGFWLLLIGPLFGYYIIKKFERT